MTTEATLEEVSVDLESIERDLQKGETRGFDERDTTEEVMHADEAALPVEGMRVDTAVHAEATDEEELFDGSRNRPSEAADSPLLTAGCARDRRVALRIGEVALEPLPFEARFRRGGPVRIVDISRRGFGILLSESPTFGRTDGFAVRHGDQFVPLEGRLVWCRLTATHKLSADEVEPEFRAGIELEEPLEAGPLSTLFERTVHSLQGERTASLPS